MPTVAECGGFMYLHTYICNICDDNDEKNNADTQNKADIQNDMNKSKLVGALNGGCHFKESWSGSDILSLRKSIAIFYRQMKK